MSGTSGKRDGLVVDRGDQSRAQQDTGTHGTVKRVV